MCECVSVRACGQEKEGGESTQTFQGFRMCVSVGDWERRENSTVNKVEPGVGDGNCIC